MEFEGSKLSLIKKKVRKAHCSGDGYDEVVRQESSSTRQAIDEMKNMTSCSSIRDERLSSAAGRALAHRAHSPSLSGKHSLPPHVESAKSLAAPARTERAVVPASIPRGWPASTPPWAIRWTCSECSRDCIPVRSESRCLCGHRLKEHKIVHPPASAKDQTPRFQCSSSRCACKHFFYIVAEGAWILRCRCKHKHIEHDCSAPPFKCSKPRCSCSGFDSPWVCNCGHNWSSHTQNVYKKEISHTLFGMQEGVPGVESLPEMANELVDELDLNYRKDGGP